MARIADRNRIPDGSGASTRYTINRFRSASNSNPSQIDILQIDDSKARKTLEDFYKVAKEGAKSTSDGIRKMWSMSTEYSDEYRKQAIENINKIEDERDATHEKEIRRINTEYRSRRDRNKALAQEMKQYNLDRIKYIKEINNADRQGLEIQRQTKELRKKYSSTILGKRIQSDLDKSQKLKVKLEAEYAKASSGNLSRDELIEIANNTDDLEAQLAEANKRIEKTIDRSERRTEGIKQAIKGFLEEAVTVLTHNYIEGVQGYFNSYESTFTEFAGRLGTGYDQTRKFYSDIISETFSNNMNEATNISKELIPAVQSALRQGFTGNNAISKAIADEQSRILMPWLDTQSDAWVNMSFNMSKQNMEILKSQQLHLQTTKEGNRLLQSGVINSMTSEMEPLLRNIDLNTGGVNNLSAEAQAMMASLVEKGMSAQDAYAMVLDAVNVQKDVYGALTSGDVTKVLMGRSAAEGKGLFEQFDSVSGLYGVASRGSNLEASALNDILNLRMVAGTPEIAREIYEAIRDKDRYSNLSGKDWEDFLKDINGRLTETKQQENVQQNSTARVGEWITAIPQGDKWFTAIIDLLKGISLAIVGGKVTSTLVDFLSSGKVGSGIVSTLKGLFGTGGSFTSIGSTFGKFISKAGWAALAYLAVENFYTSWKSKNKVDEYGEELTETGKEALEGNKYVQVDTTGESKTADDLSFKDVSESSQNAYDSTVSKANESKSGMVKGAEFLAKNVWGLSDSNVQQNISEYISAGAASGNKYKVALINSAKSMIDDYGDYSLAMMLKAYEDSGLLTEDWMWGWLGGDREYDINKKGIGALGIASKEFRSSGKLIIPKSRKTLFGLIDTGYDRGTLSRIFLGDPFKSNTSYDVLSSNVDPLSISTGINNEEFTILIKTLNNGYENYHGVHDEYLNASDRNYDNYDKARDIVIETYNNSEDAIKRTIENKLDYPIDTYAIGSPYISEDEYALLHEGERVLTRRENEVFGDIGSTGLLLAGSTLINKLLGISSLDTDDNDDISREDMTETIVQGLERITSAISSLSQGNGINYENRTLPRITNNYNSNLVNLVPSMSASK